MKFPSSPLELVIDIIFALRRSMRRSMDKTFTLKSFLIIILFLVALGNKSLYKNFEEDW